MATFEDLADDWLRYAERLEEINKETSELKKAKSEIGKQLMNYMKQHQMEDYTTEHGTIQYKRKVGKPTSVSKNALKDHLKDDDWLNLKDADELTEFVFSKLDSKVTESLSRKKVKKAKNSKKKKSSDEDDE